MNKSSVELKDFIGKESDPVIFEIEKGMIKKFAEAIEDTNPLWQNEEYANKSKYGSIIAPPTFFSFLRSFEFIVQFVEAVNTKWHLKRTVNASNELEYYLPLKLGDKISVTEKLTEIKEKEGKSGKLVFLVFETTYKNEKDNLVARGRNTLIKY